MKNEEQNLPKTVIKNVAVYCGSCDIPDHSLTDQVAALGRYLASQKMTLIYGGNNVGSMGILADAVFENGGEVIGVFTDDLPRHLLYANLSETIIVHGLTERKAEMLKRADVIVALPGSFGTWDELFDALALRKLTTEVYAEAKQCPIGVLNINGYFDHLLAFIKHSMEVGFTSPKYANLLKSASTPEDLFRQFNKELSLS